MYNWKVVNIIKGFWFKLTGKHLRMSKYRMKICNTCEYKDGAWCGKCGCLLDAKTRVVDEQCIIRKW